MASSSLKVITVVGATGNQGSSVARTFLSLPGWHVRAVARNPSSQKAEELRALGAELVRADLSDIASLVQAFGNSHAIFLNTDFWETYRSVGTGSGLTPLACSRAAYEKEVFYGKNAAIAAASVPTLERLVYSSLASIKAASNGKYTRSYHPESKAAIVSYIEAEEPALAKKMSIVIPAGYSTNPMFSPTLDPKSGQYVVVTALNRGCKMPILDPSEVMGPFVRALIEDEEPGTKLLAYNKDSFLPFEEIVQAWTEVTGKEVQIIRMKPEDLHEQLNLPWELLDGINFVNDHGYDYVLAREGIIAPCQLSNPPETKSYKAWLKGKPMEELLC
ncbi:uncharacterized protein A1O5_07081 [Cladophialophora psammophila CBS 110553]|uniref:NmrA-like domain-containing protein n=1 Tax=Cladophialophora psammophila CBS 110553 TaxID=1182543 RepID=W9WQ24_9EURO|nr:uncharacterized protein A1O5_07081 [Cladophialophora psammophila CBS 110553]EXJ70008.1 hypothetical protein A1O5_07081 [Cladophialophora psammophila CBS 110553]